jgi:hypothetical protein
MYSAPKTIELTYERLGIRPLLIDKSSSEYSGNSPGWIATKVVAFKLERCRRYVNTGDVRTC